MSRRVRLRRPLPKADAEATGRRGGHVVVESGAAHDGGRPPRRRPAKQAGERGRGGRPRETLRRRGSGGPHEASVEERIRDRAAADARQLCCGLSCVDCVCC